MKTGEKSLDDEFEMFPMGDVKEVGKKVQKMKGISNFTLISNADKGHINNKRIGMFCMLHPINRANAKWDFMRYSREASTDVEGELENVKDGIII